MGVFFLAITARGEGPVVTLVTGPEAPPLELHAASELSGLLKILFKAEVTLVNGNPPAGDARNLILLGSPDTNPAVKAACGEAWPADLGSQGHLVKSFGPRLVIGGGSPAATLWAVYEFGYANGMRYLLGGDFPPVDPPIFTLAGYDTVLRPNQSVRAWRTLGSHPSSQVSWGLADQEKLLRQLSKMKFNRLTLVMQPWQAFAGGTALQAGLLWKEPVLTVTGDTAGRSVFGGAKMFDNPDLAGKVDPAERGQAAMGLARGLIAAAHRLGMEATIELAEADAAALDQCAQNYPGVDAVNRGDASVVLYLGQPQGGMLPEIFPQTLPGSSSGMVVKAPLTAPASSHSITVSSGKGIVGFAIESSIVGDGNPQVHFLSRAAFDATLSEHKALAELVVPICGEGVSEALALGFAFIEEASALIAKEDPGFAVPAPDLFLEHYTTAEIAPEWWAKAKELYGKGVNEMYRANTRARDGARPLLLYHAKRYTFALHYLGAVEAARKAGIARAAKDEDAWAENLESAIESLHNALGIYSEVAADNSDRAVIALLNEYAYRPLLKALDEGP